MAVVKTMIDQNVIQSHTLIKAAQEVFETMVYMSIEPCEESSSHIEGHTLLGMITFKGISRGSGSKSQPG